MKPVIVKKVKGTDYIRYEHDMPVLDVSKESKRIDLLTDLAVLWSWCMSFTFMLFSFAAIFHYSSGTASQLVATTLVFAFSVFSQVPFIWYAYKHKFTYIKNT